MIERANYYPDTLDVYIQIENRFAFLDYILSKSLS